MALLVGLIAWSDCSCCWSRCPYLLQSQNEKSSSRSLFVRVLVPGPCERSSRWERIHVQVLLPSASCFSSSPSILGYFLKIQFMVRVGIFNRRRTKPKAWNRDRNSRVGSGNPLSGSRSVQKIYPLWQEESLNQSQAGKVTPSERREPKGLG